MNDPADYPRATLDIIVCATADFFRLRPDDIYGFRDDTAAVMPRALAIWIARNRFGLATDDIAREFGRLPVIVSEAEDMIKEEINQRTPFWVEAHRLIPRITQEVHAFLRY